MTTLPVAAGLPNDASADNFSAVRQWIRRAALLLADQAARQSSRLVTLTANVASTTLIDVRIASTSAILLQPTTANAAAALATTYIVEATRVNGSVTFVHANNAQADKIFRLQIGGV